MDVAKRWRWKSINAYARYEQGKPVPSIAKLDELMRAIDAAAERAQGRRIRETAEDRARHTRSWHDDSAARVDDVEARRGR